MQHLDDVKVSGEEPYAYPQGLSENLECDMGGVNVIVNVSVNVNGLD